MTKKNELMPFALLEQISVRTDSHKNDLFFLANALELIDQQKVTSDVAFAVVGPFADQCVIQPLRPKRRVVRDQRQHDLLQALHVEAPRVSQARPILDEGLGSVRRPQQNRALIACCLFQDQRSEFWPKRSALC